MALVVGSCMLVLVVGATGKESHLLPSIPNLSIVVYFVSGMRETDPTHVSASETSAKGAKGAKSSCILLSLKVIAESVCYPLFTFGYDHL